MIQGKGIIRGAKQLYNQYGRSFAGLGKKRKPVPKDLEKYDVVVVGCNLGGIFSRQFDETAAGKYTVMDVFDNNTNEVLPMRGVYEQSHVSKTEYLPNAKLALNMYTAHSDCVGVDKFLPGENTVVLRNGRKIKYEQMVVAMGLKEDISGIKGLAEAWQDLNHPVFLSKDHPSWRSNDSKHQKYHYNFTSGNAYFVIPPYPYKGEVGAFNFFISQQIWKWYSTHGKLSPLHSFTIVNANDSFCHYFEEGDAFIKKRCQDLGMRIEYGWKLIEVSKDNQTATFENIKTGEKEVRPYGNLYVIPPTVPHQNLVDSGLATSESNFLLDVDRQTLRHNKYSNIFGLGDVANLPTTKSFWAGFYQIQVARNNVMRNLQGQSLNALYDGYSKNALLMGQSSMTYIVHKYDQKAAFGNLVGSSGGILGSIRYSYWSGSQKKKFLDYYLLKNWGPPFFKTYQRFKELPGDAAAKTDSSFTPIKKEAH